MTLTFNGCLVAEIPPSVDTRLKGLWTSLTQGHEEDVFQPQYVPFGKGVNIFVIGGPRTRVVSQREVPNSAVNGLEHASYIWYKE